MKRKIIVFSLTVFTSLFIFSCSKDNGGGGGGGTGGGGGSGGSGTPGTLFLAVRSMMQTNCAVSGCHLGSNPTGGLDFSNNNTIVAQKARIKVRAVDQAGTANQMPQPPNAALSAVDQKKITDWLAAGGLLTN
jgi:uncharacterized membrane protein